MLIPLGCTGPASNGAPIIVHIPTLTGSDRMHVYYVYMCYVQASFRGLLRVSIQLKKHPCKPILHTTRMEKRMKR